MVNEEEFLWCFQPDLSRVPGLRSQFHSSAKASRLLGGPCDAVMALALLRSFLVLWKQLEVLKEHWGRLRLQVQDANPPCLHSQFSELYRWVWLGRSSCGGVEPGLWQVTALALRVAFGPWVWSAYPHWSPRKLGSVSLPTVLSRKSWVL